MHAYLPHLLSSTIQLLPCVHQLILRDSQLSLQLLARCLFSFKLLLEFIQLGSSLALMPKLALQLQALSLQLRLQVAHLSGGQGDTT